MKRTNNDVERMSVCCIEACAKSIYFELKRTNTPLTKKQYRKLETVYNKILKIQGEIVHGDKP